MPILYLSLTHTFIVPYKTASSFCVSHTYILQPITVRAAKPKPLYPIPHCIHIYHLPPKAHTPRLSPSTSPHHILITPTNPLHEKKKKRNQRTAAYNRPPPCTRAKIPYITLGEIPIFSREIKSRARHVYLFTGERRPSYS